VPTTGDLVVEVQGSYAVQEKANAIGVEDVFKNGVAFNDEYTAIANSRNNGLEGLFPMPRPNWANTAGELEAVESGPWETWDAEFWAMSQPQQCTDLGVPLSLCNWHLLGLADNPDMSQEKGTAYLDTILGYYGPRACVALDLPCKSLFANVAVEEIELDTDLVSAFPNPTSATLTVRAEQQQTMDKINLYNVEGQLIQTYTNLVDTQKNIDVTNFNNGLHIIKVYFEDGVVTKKVMIQK
jgi:hypothetical protein